MLSTHIPCSALRPTPRAPVLKLALLTLLAGAALSSAVPQRAEAAPTKRYAIATRGDFVIFGNTLAQDCGAAVVAPKVGTVGACGTNTADTAPDVFWRVDDPNAGDAKADNTVTAAMARSTAVLKLPNGATVLRAQLYWGGKQTATPSETITFERPGTFTKTVTASDTVTAALGGTFYQRSADVTADIVANGAGVYRVGGAESVGIANLNDSTVALGWYVVVIYQLDSMPSRQFALYDGLDLAIDGAPVAYTLSGLKIPATGVMAKLGIVAYEGDNGSSGDNLFVNGNKISDAVNLAENFFNSSRSTLGVAETNLGDLPQLTGDAGSMSGLDIDVVDISAQVVANATTIDISAETTGDSFALGAAVSAVSFGRPNYSGFTKTVRNVTRSDGTYRPGDEVEYTLTLQNSGQDTATDLRVVDSVPAGLTFKSNSLELVSGPAMGLKTDAAGDDEAEFSFSTAAVTFRVGAGANESQGGTQMVTDAAIVVRYRATINANTLGMVGSKASILDKSAIEVAGGGNSVDTWPSGDGTTANSPTLIDVTGGGGSQGMSPDLSVAVTSQLVANSSAVRYTVAVSNAGPGSAPSARLTYTIPPNTIISDIDAGAGWSCTPSAAQLVCTLTQALPVGSAPEVHFTVAPQVGQLTLPYVVNIQGLDDGGQPLSDPNPINNDTSGDSSGFAKANLAGGGFTCAMGAAQTGSAPALPALALLLLATALITRRRFA